jgi:hypothetical protein
MLKILNTDVSGWSQNTSDPKNGLFDASSLFTPLDGGAPNYTTIAGFSEALLEAMTGPTPNGSSTAEVLYVTAGDYTSAANATTEFDFIKTQPSWSANSVSLTPDYADTIASGTSSNSDQISVCFHFNQFFIQLDFSGFPNLTTAKNTAISFIGLFEAKINGQ